MIATPNLDELLGAEVVDPNNDTVGKVGRIYLDSERDVPTWVSVKTGLFGLAESLVPVDDATWEGQVLRVTVDKARIKDAPRVDVDQEIAPEDQERLYGYYDRAPGLPQTTGSVGESGSTDLGEVDGGRHVDRSGEQGGGAVAASAAEGARPHRSPGPDEPLGGGHHNPAAFESQEDQRLREAGRSAGDGQLGGGAQNPALLEGSQRLGTDIGELGGGNQNPALYERQEDRSLDEGDLGGGNQNPGGVTPHTGVGRSTHGGPGEFTGPGAGLAEAARRSAAQDDPGRMRPADSGAAEQQGGGMRTTDPGTAEDPAQGATGVTGARPGSGMRLRRYVVTEQQTVTMPVTREEYRLEPDDGDETAGRA